MTISDRILYETCPLCRSKEHEHLRSDDCRQHPLYHPFIGRNMHWRKCSGCSHVFTDGHFTPEALQKIFSKTNASQAVGADMERQRFVSARMIEKVLPYVEGGEWLDVGFGNGSLLLTAKEFGFHPVGVDLRQKNVEALNKLGIEAHCCPLLELDAEYKVISMADVLEHVPYPRELLTSAKRLLHSDGVLLISMPNMDAPLWSELDRLGQNPYWAEIEHYHNFGKVSLARLLAECGFCMVRYGVSERYRCCMEVVAKVDGA